MRLLLANIFLLLFIVSFKNVDAQSYSYKYRNQLSIAPFRLIDPLHSGVEVGFERVHGEFSTQLFAANLFSSTFNAAYENYKGYRFGIEEKYFLRFRQQQYFSAEAVYLFNRFNTVDRFRHDSTSTTAEFEYIDSIAIKRNITIFNLKYGRYITARRFVFDFSWGLGVRVRNIRHNNKIYPGDKLVAPRHPNVHHLANSEKKNVALNIPMNMRIGFRF